MPKTLPITEARNKLTELPEEFASDLTGEAIAVTRRGKPVLAIMPWELYESLLETLEVVADDNLMTAFRQSLQEIQKGKLIPLEEAEQRLKL